MTNTFEIRKKLDNFIDMLTINRVDRFYPTSLAKHLNISSSEAFNYLLERTGPEDQLNLKWEIRCFNCFRTLSFTEEKFFDEIECICGEEFELQSSDFYPVFQINNDYKDFLRHELKKKEKSNMKKEFPQTI